MTVGLEITQDIRDGIVVLRLEGRLDAASSPRLEAKLNELISSKQQKILIDFAKVEYLSSAGMRLLLSVTKKMKSLEGFLYFCLINEDVMEIIKMAGFEKILCIYPTEKEAFEHF